MLGALSPGLAQGALPSLWTGAPPASRSCSPSPWTPPSCLRKHAASWPALLSWVWPSGRPSPWAPGHTPSRGLSVSGLVLGSSPTRSTPSRSLKGSQWQGFGDDPGSSHLALLACGSLCPIAPQALPGCGLCPPQVPGGSPSSPAAWAADLNSPRPAASSRSAPPDCSELGCSGALWGPHLGLLFLPRSWGLGPQLGSHVPGPHVWVQGSEW